MDECEGFNMRFPLAYDEPINNMLHVAEGKAHRKKGVRRTCTLHRKKF